MSGVFKVCGMFFLIFFLCFCKTGIVEALSIPDRFRPDNKLQEVGKNKAYASTPKNGPSEEQQAGERCLQLMRNFKCQYDSAEYRLAKSLLTQYPKSIEFKDNKGQTLLIHAILHGRIDLVALFLSSLDCPLNAPIYDGNTPLLLAIKKGFIDAVVLLLIYGANPYICNNDGFNAFQLACTLNKADMIAILFHSKIRTILLKNFPTYSNHLTKEDKINIVKKE
jgi:ankyrin repeat protein